MVSSFLLGCNPTFFLFVFSFFAEKATLPPTSDTKPLPSVPSSLTSEELEKEQERVSNDWFLGDGLQKSPGFEYFFIGRFKTEV